MKLFNWKKLAQLAKDRSPFYRELYKDIESFDKLSDLPIVNQVEFWKACDLQDNSLFTSDLRDGIAFKSGGTTGNPKFSLYTRDEWSSFTKHFGEGMSKNGLGEGDRVANLFYVGELYCSFIFIMKSIEAAPVAALQFPIGGETKPESILHTVRDFQINVLCGLPTTILNVAEFYAQHKTEYADVRIEKILFGGESMYHDQRARLSEVFPGIRILSIGYASVDGGLLGYADESCDPDEHRVFSRATIMEIVDEATHQPIEEAGRPGKLLVTSLFRSFMPIIRYPVGDRAMWVESHSGDVQDRKFAILGRSEEAARVGPVSVYYEDIRKFLAKMDFKSQVSSFQLVIRHHDRKDALTLRIATHNRQLASAINKERIAQLFGEERRMFAEAVAGNKIHPLNIECVEPSAVQINQRTGKLRRVIDKRSSDCNSN